MTTVRRHIHRPLRDVYAVVVDPWTYPAWLVGAKAIRRVDPGWPAAGTRFHHLVGLGGPLTVDDSTRSLGADPPHRLELEVRVRPFGRGHVTLRLEHEAGGTRVAFDEVPIGALGWLEPVLGPTTRRRNRRSLDRLRRYCEGGQAPTRGSTSVR